MPAYMNNITVQTFYFTNGSKNTAQTLNLAILNQKLF